MWMLLVFFSIVCVWGNQCNFYTFCLNTKPWNLLRRLESILYKERLIKLGLFRSVNRRLQWDIITVPKREVQARERKLFNLMDDVGRKTNGCRQTVITAKMENTNRIIKSKHQGFEITFQSLQ